MEVKTDDEVVFSSELAVLLNEVNPEAVKFAAKSGCGRCGASVLGGEDGGEF
ncbi:hypothetical protein [Caldisericum exile]|uniref:Uncharacterized protein n=1 Tax=Caldisericum exile (strain DSM 21853 / NBRC 104410 / AZM16c01) TaxID=511051 RepID=A0A7U6GD68_CALEA|nr:hypothetical protein [Caldisericum exile]BAL80250.1 hypothetical protein CSE_01240 [Caldisericum exile AZM16c01]